MAMHSFVPPYREAKVCGVPSFVFDKLGCVAGEESLLNTETVCINLYQCFPAAENVFHSQTG
jgi:hypothetical protein